MALISEYRNTHFQLCHAVDEPPRREDYEMHMHDGYEIYCFVSGNAYYTVEGTRYELTPGSLLLMRNSESHMLVPGGSERYERYTLNFRRELFDGTGLARALLRPFHDRALGECNLYQPQELFGLDPIALFHKMEYEMSHLPARDVMLANLSTALCALGVAFRKKSTAPRPPVNRMGEEMIRYVNEHILGEIDVAHLADHVHLSPSQTGRIFKEVTGASVYHYILLKRLILARERIAAGESAKSAALSCGFGDYSAFYRLYRKHLGESPSGKRRRVTNET